MRTDLSVALGPLTLASPAILASGTFGYGTEGGDFVDWSRIGAIGLKGTTRWPRAGNPPPRALALEAALMNSVGLENVGIDVLIAEKLPPLRTLPTKRIANIAAATAEEFASMAALLAEAEGVDAIEINVSCPNVDGKLFGADPCATGAVIAAVRNAAPRMPLLAKLSPAVTDLVPIAAAAVEAGADILAIGNSFPGLAVDIERRRPVFAQTFAGVSGPAIRPLMLRLVWQVHRAMPKVPIVGTGGISTASDAIEYLLAGACAFGVGAASLLDPGVANEIVDGIEGYCAKHGVSRVRELTGAMST